MGRRGPVGSYGLSHRGSDGVRLGAAGFAGGNDAHARLRRAGGRAERAGADLPRQERGQGQRQGGAGQDGDAETLGHWARLSS
jgi:hypothetical protein